MRNAGVQLALAGLAAIGFMVGFRRFAAWAGRRRFIGRTLMWVLITLVAGLGGMAGYGVASIWLA
jgi:hypothetical protein